MTTPGVNWGMIRSGATFERMVCGLVFFEDPGSHLLGRRGPDGGQDALSADGSTVWQAKHHEKPTAAKAIADAKAELGKIKAYRAPTHPRSGQWHGVSKWVLATNAEFGSKDVERWKKEVVPKFAALGIDARQYWEAIDLEQLLGKHPFVRDAFFEGHKHVVQSIGEAGESLRADERFLARPALDTDLVGRASELEEAREFIADDDLSFLLVTGRGGVGKTRFLYEVGADVAASGGRDVYWANVETMTHSADWFTGIVPERNVLLLVDEPEDETLLKQLVEQVRQVGGRAHKWKVAVAVRSWRDPVVRFLTSPTLKARTQRVELSPLGSDEGAALARALLEGGPLAKRAGFDVDFAAEKLAQRFDDHPVWVTLGVSLLEAHGDLAQVPTEAADLARQYLHEASGPDQKRPVALAVLRWTALLGVVNREAERIIEIVAARVALAPADLLAELGRLVGTRVLDQRGTNQRLVEVKPDVIRDQLLRDWLVRNVGFGSNPYRPSPIADEFVAEIAEGIRGPGLTEFQRGALMALARTDWLLRAEGVDAGLMAKFFGLLEAMLPDLGAEARSDLGEKLTSFAAVVPELVVELSRAQRQQTCAAEERQGYLGAIRTDHDDVLVSLPWMLFNAAHGAVDPGQRNMIVHEFAVLAAEEARVERERRAPLPNDGKRATELLRRLAGDSYGAFDQSIGEAVVGQLRALASNELTEDEIEALVKLARIATDVTRRADEFTEATFSFQHYIPGPDAPMWRYRDAIVETAMTQLSSSASDSGIRRALWRVLFDAKQGAASHIPTGSAGERLSGSTREILEFAKEQLGGREVGANELHAARRIWSWYVSHDSESELGAIAMELDAKVRAHPVAGVLEPLVGDVYDDQEWLDEAISRAVEQLEDGSSEEIAAFIRAAADYAADESRLVRLVWVAHHLAATGTPGMLDFIRSRLGDDASNHWERQFAIQGAVGRVEAGRTNDPEGVVGLLEELLGAASPVTAARLLRAVYDHYPGRFVKTVAAGEREFVLQSKERFALAGDPSGYFSCIGWTLILDEDSLRGAVEDALAQIPSEDLGGCVQSLIDGVGKAVGFMRRRQPPLEVSEDLGQWLLGLVVRVPDLSSAFAGNGMTRHHLDEIFKLSQRPGRATMVSLLEARRSMEDVRSDMAPRITGLSFEPRLTQFVRPIADEPDSDSSWAAELVRLVRPQDRDDVSMSMKEIFRDFDGAGQVLPDMVSELAENQASDRHMVEQCARLATAYAVGSKPWRKIATAVLKSVPADSEDLPHLYWCLTNPGGRTFRSRPGEVPPVYLADVRHASERLASESEPTLRLLWAWEVEQAEATLERKRAELKERRGE